MGRLKRQTLLIRLVLIVCLLATGMLTVALADTVQRVLWNKDFIPVAVPIGKEKIIEVCAKDSPPGHCQTVPLQAFLPQAEVDSGTLKWINNAGTLYLSASKAFSPKLAELRLKTETGESILLKVSANKAANQNRLEILLPKPDASSATSAAPSTGPVSMGTVISWVAKELYAPRRLLTNPGWIARVPMQTQHFVPLYQGGVVSAMPLASWRFNHQYVTAVLLRNTTSQSLKLSINLFRGGWQVIAFMRYTKLNPSELTPQGTLYDSTSAILVSNAPFTVALNEGAGDA